MVWSKVQYMVRTEPRVQFLVLKILLWTWPNWTLTTLIVIEIMDHDLCVTIDQVHWLFVPRISPYGPYGPTIQGMSQGCLGWSRTILLLFLDFYCFTYGTHSSICTQYRSKRIMRTFVILMAMSENSFGPYKGTCLISGLQRHYFCGPHLVRKRAPYKIQIRV